MQIFKEGGLIAWSARLLELTPLDFLWSCVELKVHYAGKLETSQGLLQGIDEAAAAAVRNGMEMHQNMRHKWRDAFWHVFELNEVISKP
jgi:hypothetical protein